MYNESTWCWRCLQDLQPLYVWLVIANQVRRASNYCHHLKRIDGLLTRLRLGKRRHLLRATPTWVCRLLETNRFNWACIDTYSTLSNRVGALIGASRFGRPQLLLAQPVLWFHFGDNMYRPPGAADREFWLYFVEFWASKLVWMGPTLVRSARMNP